MRPVRVLWPCFFFFFFLSFGHLAFLPLVVPARGGAAGWVMPAFFPSCGPGSLRPVLFRPLVHMVWLFPGPLVCKLFLFFGLFASMVVSILLPHSGRGTNLIKKAVNTSEKVSWVKLLSILPRLTFVGRLDWPSFHKYAPKFFWTESTACMIGLESRVEGFRLGFGRRIMALEFWCASCEPNSFCWTCVTCHRYCESGSRGCLAGCNRAPSFSEACDWEISSRVGKTTSKLCLIEGIGITRSAPSGWRRPAQNAACTRGLSGSGTAKGTASLAIRTCWTSSRCFVWGAMTVDCKGGKRGRTIFRYVTGKVAITRRVGRLLMGAWIRGCKCTTPSIVCGEGGFAGAFVDELTYSRDFLH